METAQTQSRATWLKPTALLGAALVLTALLVPTTAWITLLRGNGSPSPQLALGTNAFRLGLSVLGLVTIVLGQLPLWGAVAARPGFRAQATSRTALWVLGGLLALSLALRLIGLNEGLWHDEIVTDVLFVKSPFGVILTSYEGENQHFLFSLMAHTTYLLFGDSPWALRLPAVFFGVASLGALYLLGRYVTSTREALLSVALLGLSYQHVWFSQNARGYTGLLFWTLLASWLLLRALDERQVKWWLWYAGAAALGVYTHTTMLFVIAAHFITYAVALYLRRREPWPYRWAGLFIGFPLAGLLTFQLYSFVLTDFLGGMGREQSVVDAWKNPLWTLGELIKGIEISFLGGAVALGGVVVFGAGLVSYWRRRREVIEFLILPAALTTAVVVGLGHHLWPRFFFMSLGFAVLVAIRGTMVWAEVGGRLLRLSPALRTALGTAVCLGLIAVSAVSVRSAYAPKQDYAGALAYVRANQQPGDVIVTGGLAAFTINRYYRFGWQEIETAQQLDTVRAQAKRVWFVYSFPTVLESVTPDVMASLRRDFKVEREFWGTVGDGQVVVARADGK